MKTISKYQQAKTTLKTEAIEAKKKYPTDKPMIRMIINDTTDLLCKNFRLSN